MTQQPTVEVWSGDRAPAGHSLSNLALDRDSSLGVLPRYSPLEELIHSATHAVATLLAIGGLLFIWSTARRLGDDMCLVSGTIYGTTLLAAYFFSTVYHGTPRSRLKVVFRSLDQSAIFLLIAGTYTPLCMISLGDGWGPLLCSVVWGMAAVGITMIVFFNRRFRVVAVSLYVVMGWTGSLLVKPLFAEIGPDGFLLLVLGGVSYTAGVVFYSWKKLPFHHAIWHLLAMAGSAFHFATIVLYVLPNR